YLYCPSTTVSTHHALSLISIPPTATTQLYTLSLHDALPIYPVPLDAFVHYGLWFQQRAVPDVDETYVASIERQDGQFHITLADRSEEHTSELQSRFDLVCRLLLEKKNKLLYILCSIILNNYI